MHVAIYICIEHMHILMWIMQDHAGSGSGFKSMQRSGSSWSRLYLDQDPGKYANRLYRLS